MTLETPERYQRFLEKYGGLNPYREPSFRLDWDSKPIERSGVPPQFLEPYLNCWVLSEWMSPEECEGIPDTDTSRGLYNPVWVFKDGNRAVMLDSEYLNLNVLAAILKVFHEHKYDSLSKRYHFLKDDRAERDLKEHKRLVDQIEDGAPAFIGAATGYGNGACNTVIQKRIEQIEKNMERIRDFRRFGRGPVVANQGSLCQV